MIQSASRVMYPSRSKCLKRLGAMSQRLRVPLWLMGAPVLRPVQRTPPPIVNLF